MATDLYAYRPSNQTGEAGSFVHFGQVPTSSGDQFVLLAHGGRNVIGHVYNDQVLKNDFAIVHCP